MLVVMAGVDGNWRIVYKTISEKSGKNVNESTGKKRMKCPRLGKGKKSGSCQMTRTCEKDWNRDEKTGNGTNTSDGRVPQELFNPKDSQRKVVKINRRGL